jgi:hypothetical protein
MFPTKLFLRIKENELSCLYMARLLSLLVFGNKFKHFFNLFAGTQLAGLSTYLHVTKNLVKNNE